MLDQSVLVLNKHWLAVHICNVKRALSLIYQGLARVVSEDYQTYDFESWKDLSLALETDRAVSTATFQIVIPEVIVLTRFGRLPPREVKFNRRNIYLRDRYTCQYCGRKPDRVELTIDHVTPRSRGGKSIWENVVLACTRCNTTKGDKTIVEASMSLIRNPKKPHWLLCIRKNVFDNGSPMWQKFVDVAYWNVTLNE